VVIIVVLVGILIFWHTKKKTDYKLEKPDNWPRSMEKKGHEVLSIDKTGNSEWKILVKIK
jgi:hypothetical protein